jgi:cation transport regulator
MKRSTAVRQDTRATRETPRQCLQPNATLERSTFAKGIALRSIMATSSALLLDNVKNNLPKRAQEIYKEAFNSAEEQYGEEDRAHRVAWSAVEQKYEKNDQGNWVSKES